METSGFIATMEAIHREGLEYGLYYQNCTDAALRGRHIEVEGRDLLSFSSCSYLGLEHHPLLVKGVVDAVKRFGTQFSASRAYVSMPLYEELEHLLSQIFGGHALVSSSTTLGHQSCLTTLVTEKDAIVLDHQAHTSIHLAARLAQAGGAHVEVIRHNDLERGYEAISRLAKKYRSVWFASDGVFSMYGDLAPIGLFQEFLDIAPNVRLYVDDAHGMSWAGRHGCGSFLSRMPLSDRMIVATSLNKAFSAGGGVLIFPREEEKDLMRFCGGPQVFSGPLQPPTLGAAVASARLHLSPEITLYQEQLRERVDLINFLLEETGLPLLVKNEAPIFFVRMGSPKVACAVAQRMMDDGFFINPSMYPTVPMKRAGIRLSVNVTHELDDIRRMIDSLAHHATDVLGAEGISPVDLDELFAKAVPEEAWKSEQYQAQDNLETEATGTYTIHESKELSGVYQSMLSTSQSGTLAAAGGGAPRVEEAEMAYNSKQASQDKLRAASEYPTRALKQSSKGLAEKSKSPKQDEAVLLRHRSSNVSKGKSKRKEVLPNRSRTSPRTKLHVQHFHTIQEVDRTVWDTCLGSVGICNWEAMATWEKLFCNQEKRENNWDFDYILVMDEQRKPVAATFFTHLLVKDDMLMRPAVSHEVESRRKKDPYFLTSTCMMMGCLCSEGNHLYLDRKGPWKDALLKLLEVASQEYEKRGDAMLMLRDLPSDDSEMAEFLLTHGFSKVPMLDTHTLHITWKSDEELLQSFRKKQRYQVRHSLIKPAQLFKRKLYGLRSGNTNKLSREELAYLYQLYRNVADNKVRLNVFPLPSNILSSVLKNPSWELVTFSLPEEHGGPGKQPVSFYVSYIHEDHYMPFFCGLDYDYVAKHGAYRQMVYHIMKRAIELDLSHVHYGVDADFIKSRLGTDGQKNSAYVQVRDHFQGSLLRDIVASVALSRS